MGEKRERRDRGGDFLLERNGAVFTGDRVSAKKEIDPKTQITQRGSTSFLSYFNFESQASDPIIGT